MSFRTARALLLSSPLLAVMAVTTLVRDARAADCSVSANTCIDSDLLWPTPGPSTFFSVASPLLTAKGHFTFGLANAMQHDPIVLRKSPAGPAGDVGIPSVGTQLNTTFLFAYGITDRLQVDLATPVTLYQSGTGVSTATDGSATGLPSNGVRDLRIGAAYSIVPLSRVRLQGVGFGARFDLSVPTGDRESFGGEEGVVAVPSLMLEDRLGPIVFSAQFGARFRKTTTFFDKPIGSQGYLAAGLAGTVDRKHDLALTGEVFALPSLVADGPSPIQWLAGVRWSQLLGGDFMVHAGGGGSFRAGERAQLLEPAWRAVLDIRYAPLALDRDGDGIADRDDKCPDQPEDRDGFEDLDGCPDVDNDKDGIVDKLDQCPNDAEDFEGFEDTDGCPEPDRDGDGIKDKVDKCPDQAEDKDGYQDDDGCPEGGAPKATKKCADGSKVAPDKTCDSDHDGLADDVDQCPLAAEDFDKIVDEDGCPEKDADEDGVGDQVDKCPLEPETIDGKDDDDGCPEAGAEAQVKFQDGAIELLKPIRFANGAATLTKPMKLQLAMIAQRVQGLVDRGVEKIVIEAWADSAGENKANEALAQKRADAIVAGLVAWGIPEGLIKARPGDLADPPKSPKANWLVTVRTKRKAPLMSPNRAP